MQVHNGTGHPPASKHTAGHGAAPLRRVRSDTGGRMGQSRALAWLAAREGASRTGRAAVVLGSLGAAPQKGWSPGRRGRCGPQGPPGSPRALSWGGPCQPQGRPAREAASRPGLPAHCCAVGLRGRWDGHRDCGALGAAGSTVPAARIQAPRESALLRGRPGFHCASVTRSLEGRGQTPASGHARGTRLPAKFKWESLKKLIRATLLKVKINSKFIMNKISNFSTKAGSCPAGAAPHRGGGGTAPPHFPSDQPAPAPREWGALLQGNPCQEESGLPGLPSQGNDVPGMW